MKVTCWDVNLNILFNNVDIFLPTKKILSWNSCVVNIIHEIDA